MWQVQNETVLDVADNRSCGLVQHVMSLGMLPVLDWCWLFSLGTKGICQMLFLWRFRIHVHGGSPCEWGRGWQGRHA